MEKAMLPKTPKLRLWLKFFLDETNPTTFLNKTEAAKAAGYSAKSAGQLGWQNYKKLQSQVTAWLDEYGLSVSRLKQKLFQLIEAKEIKIIKVKGSFKPEDQQHGIKVIGQSHSQKGSGQGEDAEAYDDVETVIAISMEALETQRRSLDMAMKWRGMFAKDNKQKRPEVILAKSVPPEKREALTKAYQEILRARSYGGTKAE